MSVLGAISKSGKVDMRSVAQHQQAVVQLLKHLIDVPTQGNDHIGSDDIEQVELSSARSRRLAQDLFSTRNIPSFDNSQMDGYAVRSADLAAATPAHPVTLPTMDAIAAGESKELKLLPGHAAPIMTGAPIPAGADAVVAVEKTSLGRFTSSPLPAHVDFVDGVAAGTFIRTEGSDVRVGDPLLRAGAMLDARALGLLATAGVSRVPVLRPLRVLVVSSGSELCQPGNQLEAGQIYDANSTLLCAALGEEGAEVRVAPLIPDSASEFLDTLHDILADPHQVDLVLTSGGISAGAFEVVREALTGHDVEFVSVAVQPGGPQGVGRVFGVPLLAFPGNPASAFVSFELFLRPVLRAAAGHVECGRRETRGRLSQTLESPSDKHQLRRGILYDNDVVEPLGGPGSHLLSALASANVLIHIPVGVSTLVAGSEVTVWELSARRPAGVHQSTVQTRLTHVDGHGSARMVDVSTKTPSAREATARAFVTTSAEVIAALRAANLPKGDALATARIAGIAATKRTAELIPLCHPLPLTGASVELTLAPNHVEITATVRTTAVTGVEMEALTAVSVAGLTLYDMIKALDPGATLRAIALWHKKGGKSGEWRSAKRPAEKTSASKQVSQLSAPCDSTSHDSACHDSDSRGRPSRAVPVKSAGKRLLGRVIIASTRAANSSYVDTTGPVIVSWLRERGLTTPPPVVVADGLPVEAALREAINSNTDVVLTSGGTGLSPDDRTPEITQALLDRHIPGIAEAMRRRGEVDIASAILTRGCVGVAKNSLVVNLPGSASGVRTGLAVLDGVLEHLVAQISGTSDHRYEQRHNDQHQRECDEGIHVC